MRPLQRLAAWLDVRPNEVRYVTLSFLGAFFVMAFLVLARSLREAFYLATFRIETLPYITGTVAILSIPTVGTFGRLLTKYSPKRVLVALLFILAAGLLALAPFREGGFLSDYGDIGIIAFYIWTALGTLLLTSGFWVVTSEYFAVRGAKRLFGLIGAGGTAGAMVLGTMLVWLTDYLSTAQLILGLIGLLFLFYLTQQLLPTAAVVSTAEGEGRSSFIEGITLAWRSPHLRTISLIVFVVALATTLLDFQFKELAQASFSTDEALASFFGAFYGWTGAIALVIQLLVVARFLTMAGVAWSLALLPIVLGLGSVGMLIVPSLVLVTAVRGADATLRKSLYRSALEVLYVPVPPLLRRKTKTFVDSVVDSIGEGLGAGLIFVWVTALALPSRFFSLFIIAASFSLIVLSRRMGRQYFATVSEQLQVSGERAEAAAIGARLDSRDLLSGTFTRIDIRSLIDESVASPAAEAAPDEAAEREEPEADVTLARLNSAEVAVVARTLDETRAWHESHLPLLCRLLARDPLVDRAVAALMAAGDPATPYLAELLTDDATDFVIRRRIPRVLARMGGPEAEDALLDALAANRFEVRYRAAIALTHRREQGHPRSERDEESIIWAAIRSELGRSRPVWEMQKLLDEEPDDELVVKRVGVRGELSLEHAFRLLGLVLEPEAVRAAFNGVVLSDERLKSFSLEYLEQVLPADVRKRLWPFIGDVSEYKRAKLLRPLDDVVTDLMNTGATLFGDEQDRAALRRMLEEQED
jgi:ATP/ADP translocase